MRYLILFAMLPLLSSCGLILPDACEKEYKFTIPFRLYPEKDTFRIGDTLWLESEIPPLLYDSISQQEYSLGSFKHIVYASFNRKDDSTQLSTGSSNFDYASLTGACQRGIQGPSTEFRFNYRLNADLSNSLKFYFIPKVKGLYSFSMYTLTYDDYSTDDGRNDRGIISKPCLEVLWMRFRTNNADKNNNFALLEGNPYITQNESIFHSAGAYAFWVAE
jgi:hypothetical protein